MKPDEVAMLDAICKSGAGSLNRSEKLRQLLVREFRRRAVGRSKGSESELMTDVRTGRPRGADGVSSG